MNEYEQQAFEFYFNEKIRQYRIDASKRMKRLGIICLLVVLLDIMVALFVTRFSIPIIFSITVCFLTAIFDFYKSAMFAKEAKKNKGE